MRGRSPKIIAALVMTAGLSWVAYVLFVSADNIHYYLPTDFTRLLWASGLVAASFATNWYLFHKLLCFEGAPACTPLNSVRLQVAAQLLRYLPGRVWGILYQVAAARGQIPGWRIARANLDLMAFSILGSSAIACLIMGARLAPGGAYFAVLGVTMLVAQWALFMGGADRVLAYGAKRLPESVRPYLVALSRSRFTLSSYLSMQAWFVVGWILYVLAWEGLGAVFPAFADVDFILLAAYYTLASVAGILSVLTPAGLGVREAAFMLLAATSVGQETAAFFAIFGRLWLMLIEVVLLFITYVVSVIVGARR